MADSASEEHYEGQASRTALADVSAGPLLPTVVGSAPLAITLFHDMAEASQRIVAHINTMTPAERKIERQKLRTMATENRKEAKSNDNMASISNAIGGVLGGGLLTGSVVLFATAPISMPLVAIAVAGGVALAAGLGSGFVISAKGIDQDHRAELIDNMVEEIDP